VVSNSSKKSFTFANCAGSILVESLRRTVAPVKEDPPPTVLLPKLVGLQEFLVRSRLDRQASRWMNLLGLLELGRSFAIRHGDN